MLQAYMSSVASCKLHVMTCIDSKDFSNDTPVAGKQQQPLMPSKSQPAAGKDLLATANLAAGAAAALQS